MCWALNHQNIIEIAQGHISLSVPLFQGTDSGPRAHLRGGYEPAGGAKA
jgi:hypothetical protein